MKRDPKIYLEVSKDPKIQMSGKGAPRSTVYGALGVTQMSDGLGFKALGGLVRDTKTGMSLGAGTYMSEAAALKEGQSEKMILGAPSKTNIPGQHYGQVPYPGYYMSALGKRL